MILVRSTWSTMIGFSLTVTFTLKESSELLLSVSTLTPVSTSTLKESSELLLSESTL